MPLPLRTDFTQTSLEHVKSHNEVNSEVNILARSTFWRNISSGATSLLVNGWTGSVTIRRDNNLIYCRLGALNGSAATSDKFLSMPAGFSPVGPLTQPSRATDDSVLWVRIVGGTDAASGLHASRAKQMISGVETLLMWYASPTSPFPSSGSYPGISS